MMDETTQPETLDPATFHLGGPGDMALTDHLRFLIQVARQAAPMLDQACLIYLEEKDGEPHYKIQRVSVEQLLTEAAFPCPRAADLAFQAEHGIPRPLPSALVYPDGRVVVSKPGLCSSCSHDLNRRVQGQCLGRTYEPLIR